MVFGSNLPKPNITRWFSEIRLSAAFVLKIELAPHFFTQHTQFDHLWHYFNFSEVDINALKFALLLVSPFGFLFELLQSASFETVFNI